MHTHRVTPFWPLYWFSMAGLLLYAPVCGSMSSMYDAQVFDRDGQPCFTVSEHHTQDSPKLATIRVFTEDGALGNVIAKGRAKGVVWKQSSIYQSPLKEGEPFFFSPSTCLLYGTPLKNVGDYSTAQKLEIGAVYSVNINTHVKKDSSWESRRYQAQFCLSRTPHGETKVLQIIYDHGWRYEVCKP